MNLIARQNSTYPYHSFPRRVAAHPSVANAVNNRSPQVQAKPKLATLPDQPDIGWVATGKCFTFPALGGLLFGYDIGASSQVVVSLTSPTLSGTDWGPALTSLQSGLLVGVSLFGALGASVIAMLAGDVLGRRKELLAAAACYAGGAVMMGMAPSLNMLMAGRALYGMGIGLAMHAAPAYISETSPARVRGLLISFKEALIVGGILLGYIMGYETSEQVGGWREMYGLALPLAGLLAAGMATLPESPRWLLLSGKGREAASEALVQAEGIYAREHAAYVKAQIDNIQQNLDHSAQTLENQQLSSTEGNAKPAASTSKRWVLFEDRYRRPLAVGCSLMLFQQITGQPSVLYRAASILTDAGFQGGKGAASVAVLLGVFKLMMTLVATTQVDTQGRRPLLLYGVSGMVLALLMLGAAPSLQEAMGLQGMLGPAAGVPTAAWISAAALLLYVGCYQISFGPISWLIVGELFPLRARSQALAFASLVNFGGNFAVSSILPTLTDQLGASNTYFLFAAMGIASVACIAATVPETKGKTLEEIEAMWESPEGTPLKTL